MTVSSFLALARDLAAILAGASAIGAAAVFWSGGASAGVAAAAAAAAVGAAIGIGAIGALSLGGASPLVSAAAIALLCLGVAAAGAQFGGARGLWLALLAIGGVGVGALIAVAFARAGVLGPAGPLAALAALSVLAAGALGAGATAARHAEAPPPMATAHAAAGQHFAASGFAAATAPPAWFAGLYARLGGAAGDDRPPDLAAAMAPPSGQALLPAVAPPPEGRWPQPAAPDANPEAAQRWAPLRLPAPTIAAPRAFGSDGAPARAAAPTPDQSAEPLSRTASGPAAQAAPLFAPLGALTAPSPVGDPGADGPASPTAALALAVGPPAFAPAPVPPARPAGASLSALSLLPSQTPQEPSPWASESTAMPSPAFPRAAPASAPSPPPRPVSALVSIAGRLSVAAASPPGAGRSVAASAPRPAAATAQLDPAPTAPRAPRERMRTMYVCFPLLGAEADRFCALGADAHTVPPLGPGDVEISWRARDGAARGAVDEVACFIDRDLANHVTLVVALPTDPAAMLPGAAVAERTAAALGDADVTTRRGEAIYAATAQLIGAVRSRQEGGALYLSAYFANGAQLAGPWAAHAFGADRADRLFDIRSSGQTLDLLRRLKEEVGAPRAAAAPGALAAAIIRAAEERPAPSARSGQSLLVAVVDATAAAEPTAEEAAAIAKAARGVDAPLFVIALTNGEPAPAGLAEAAEATGGAAYAATTLSGLAAAMERVMLRAQGYCAVRLTAAPSLLSLGELELRVKRRTAGGCAFVQTARLNCGAVELRDAFAGPDDRR